MLPVALTVIIVAAGLGWGLVALTLAHRALRKRVDTAEEAINQLYQPKRGPYS